MITKIDSFLNTEGTDSFLNTERTDKLLPEFESRLVLTPSSSDFSGSSPDGSPSGKSPESALLLSQTPSQKKTDAEKIESDKKRDADIQAALKALNALDELITFSNTARLYEVWGGSTLQAVMDMSPNNSIFDHARTVQSAYASSVVWTSHIFYYLRPIIKFAVILIEVGSLPAAEQEEAFKKKMWEQKFWFLNDIPWAISNALCHLLLHQNDLVIGKSVIKGSELKGWSGNVLCFALLLWDLAMCAWRFQELRADAAAKCEEEFIKFNQMTLIKTITSADQKNINDARLSLKMAELDLFFTETATMLDLAYSILLTAVFCIACSGFVVFPAAAELPKILNLVGSLLSFGFTVIHSIVNGGAGVYKAEETRALLEEECTILLLQIVEYQSDDKFGQDLYLRMKNLMQTATFEEESAFYQRYDVIFFGVAKAGFPAAAMAILAAPALSLAAGIGIIFALVAVLILAFLISKFYLQPVKTADIKLEDLTGFQDWKKSVPEDVGSQTIPDAQENAARRFLGFGLFSVPGKVQEEITDQDDETNRGVTNPLLQHVI